MSEFLVEAYVPRATVLALAPRVEDVSVAADELAKEGAQVRFVQCIFVPEDEICFYLYEARSADAVREAASRAGLEYERITEAFADSTPELG